MNRKFTPPNVGGSEEIEKLIKKKIEDISDKELIKTTEDLKRFARTVVRIIKEPQFRVYFKKSKKNKKVWQKIYELRRKEFSKLRRGEKKIPLGEMFQRFEEIKEKDEKR